MPSRATMGSPNPARDEDRDGWEVAPLRSADSYDGRLGRLRRFDDMQGVPRLDGGRRSLTPQDCEFLAAQILKNEGHFRYSGSDPEYDRRRADLIDLLTREGLR